MKQFIIDENQINLIFKCLGEFPAKHVLSAIDMLRTLPPFVTHIEVEEPKTE